MTAKVDEAMRLIDAAVKNVYYTATSPRRITLTPEDREALRTYLQSMEDAPKAVAGEAGQVPVLYQWFSDGLWINLGNEKNLEGMRNAGYEVRALYASPPPVMVVPEQWNVAVQWARNASDPDSDPSAWTNGRTALSIAKIILAMDATIQGRQHG